MTDCFFSSSSIYFPYHNVLTGSSSAYGMETNNGDNRHPSIFPDFNGIIFSFVIVYDVFFGLFVDSFLSYKGSFLQFAMNKLSQ